MRVLFVTHNFPRFDGDAPGAFVWRLASALQALPAPQPAITVDVLAPAARDLPARESIGGVAVERVAYGGLADLAYSGTMAETVAGSWRGPVALLRLIDALRRSVRRRLRDAVREGRAYDVVHAHWWFPGGLAARVALVGEPTGIPLVVTMHGSDVRFARTLGASQPPMRWVLRRAASVTAVSSWLAREATAIVPDVAIDVAPMPIDVARFASRTPATTTTDGALPPLLFVGRLNAQKGLGDLLTALARTSAPVTLDVVGDGPLRSELRAQAASLGLGERVRWLGALPNAELPARYASALATVMPSREEGLGLVAAESQLCGTPVIAYDSGGIADVATPEAGNTLVAAGDIDALARAIDRVAADPARARARGVEAAAAVRARFAPDIVARGYAQRYHDAIGRRG